MVFAINKPLERWGRVLQYPDLTEAILDPVFSRGRIVTLEEPSIGNRHLSTLCRACRTPRLPHETPSQLFSRLFAACTKIPGKILPD